MSKMGFLEALLLIFLFVFSTIRKYGISIKIPTNCKIYLIPTCSWLTASLEASGGTGTGTVYCTAADDSSCMGGCRGQIPPHSYGYCLVIRTVLSSYKTCTCGG